MIGMRLTRAPRSRGVGPTSFQADNHCPWQLILLSFHPRHLLSRKYHPEFFVPKLFLGLSLCQESHKRGRVGQHGNGKCTISSIINKTFYNMRLEPPHSEVVILALRNYCFSFLDILYQSNLDSAHRWNYNETRVTC